MKRKSITQEEINKVPTADWYTYILECGNWFLSKVRIVVPKDYSFQEHMVLCTADPCRNLTNNPSNWKFIVGMYVPRKEIVDSATMDKFITPGRILRTGNPNPYPYSIGKNRDY